MKLGGKSGCCWVTSNDTAPRRQYHPCDPHCALDQLALDCGNTTSATFSHYLTSSKCRRGSLLLLLSGLPPNLLFHQLFPHIPNKSPLLNSLYWKYLEWFGFPPQILHYTIG